jgi:hypothetical protein
MHMSKAPSNFRETDVKRLIRAATNAGQKVVRIKLQAGGVELVTADGDAGEENAEDIKL